VKGAATKNNRKWVSTKKEKKTKKGEGVRWGGDQQNMGSGVLPGQYNRHIKKK